MKEVFRRFSAQSAELVGSHWAFAIAASIIIVWSLTGPLFHF
jgi:low affinity Fe/Cu permease